MSQIRELVTKSQYPLKNTRLEDLQNQLGKPHNYYRFLYYLVSTFQPELCLEIGTWYGMGSTHMCSSAKIYGGQVIGIDIYGNSVSDTFDNYHFIESNSLQAGNNVKKLVKEYGKLGLVFQDSSHHYLSSCKEWNIYSSLMNKNGIWLCDDITESFYNPEVDPFGKGMVQYFEERPGTKELFPDILHHGSTMGVILS